MAYPANVGRPFFPRPATQAQPQAETPLSAPIEPSPQPKEDTPMRQKKTEAPEEYSNPMTTLRAKLSGAKALSPLLSAVFQFPGLSSDPKVLTDAIGEICTLHQQTTKLVAEALLPGDLHPAKKASVAAALAHLVGQAWSKDSKGIEPKTLAAMYIQTLEISTPLPDQAFDEQFPRVTSEALAEARTVADLLPALMRVDAMGDPKKLFWGGHSLESATGLAKADLEGRARAMAEKLLPPGSSEEQQSIAYRSILKTATPVYAQVLNTEINLLGRSLKDIQVTLSMCVDKAKKLPQGDELDKINKRIQECRDQQKQFMAEAAKFPQGVLLARVQIQMDKAMKVLFPEETLAQAQKTTNAPADEEESHNAPA